MTTQMQRLASIRAADERITDLISGKERLPRKANEVCELLRRIFHHYPGASDLERLVRADQVRANCRHRDAMPMPMHNLFACVACRSIVDGNLIQMMRAQAMESTEVDGVTSGVAE